jgi:hypothetical protein
MIRAANRIREWACPAGAILIRVALIGARIEQDGARPLRRAEQGSAGEQREGPEPRQDVHPTKRQVVPAQDLITDM